jgi:cholinesterase
MKSLILLSFNFALGIESVCARFSDIQARQSSWMIGQTIKTHSGLIEGHAAPNASQVSEYLGIPFAQPPLGKLRFAPPVKYAGNTTIEAAAFVRDVFITITPMN